MLLQISRVRVGLPRRETPDEGRLSELGWGMY